MRSNEMVESIIGARQSYGCARKDAVRIPFPYSTPPGRTAIDTGQKG
jgi:hypothetical protein